MTQAGLTVMTTHKGEGIPLRIYLEGDGRAFFSRTQPSVNPTPVNPTGLQLALADGAPELAYAGRPCMWVWGKECAAGYPVWTVERFNASVSDAYVELVEHISRGQPVELVGYSGGAWVALQVAARLDNVVGVRTVAGNVDPDYFNAMHKVTRFAVAPWPAGGRLARVPQVHYVGTRDKIVPREVVDHYIEEQGACARVVAVEAEHEKGWVEAWPKLLDEPMPVCGETGTGNQGTGARG